MPTPDYDPALLSGVSLTQERGHWRLHLRYNGQSFDLGTFLHFEDAHRAYSASALAKALGSPEKRATHQVTEAERS